MLHEYERRHWCQTCSASNRLARLEVDNLLDNIAAAVAASENEQIGSAGLTREAESSAETRTV